MKRRKILILLIVLTINNYDAFAQASKVTRVENVPYGFVAGMALLMDVYQPENSNHLGIIYIAGSAWGSPPIWSSQLPVKELYNDSAYAGKWPQSLIKKGYTVFMINHSFAPRFKYPDIFFDCQRAVRFVRFHAKKYDIDPNRIGIMGHSSGANLSAMLGVKDTTIVNPENEIDRVSSKVQAVVTLAAPFILSDYNSKTDSAIQNNLMLSVLVDYLGELPEIKNGEFILSGKYAEASPITYVSKDDAAFLIYYSDNDHIVPPRQAPVFYNKLKENNVQAKIVVCHKCKHEPIPDMNEVDMWFMKNLRRVD